MVALKTITIKPIVSPIHSVFMQVFIRFDTLLMLFGQTKTYFPYDYSCRYTGLQMLGERMRDTR